MTKNNILFLTIKVFSATGGIEKVCRIAGKVLSEVTADEESDLRIHSIYDDSNEVNEKYFPASIFKGFRGNKVSFFISSVKRGLASKVILLSHTNLLTPAILVKFLSPATKVILITHGIEVWKPFSARKRKMLHKCDIIICVSEFTKKKMLELHNVEAGKCRVLNNCLDPFLDIPAQTGKPAVLLQKYGIRKDEVVLLTLSRLSAHDRDKGYEKVLIAMQQLNDKMPELKYLIVGKYKEEEKLWLEEMILKMNLQGKVVITGFVADEELANHFAVADLYVMPSTKEGFGIIFIEAMYYGLPVIAGDKDGSVDALANGEFGLLVDPTNQAEITAAIVKVTADKARYVPKQNKLLERFGYLAYKEKLQRMVEEVKIGG